MAEKTITLNRAEKAGAEIISAYDAPCDLRRPGNALLARIERVSASLKKDKPLVVIMGENHSAPAHKLLQAYVVKGLLQRQHKVAVSFEVPHNYLGYLLEKNTPLSITPQEKNRLEQIDKTGQRSLVTSIAFGTEPYGPLSSRAILKSCPSSSIASVMPAAPAPTIQISASML